MNLPQVAVVVLNWNGMLVEFKGTPILKSALDGLTKSDYEDFKIILIDADSVDTSVEFVKANFPQVDIVRTSNIGWAYNNNRGLDYIIRTYPNARYIVIMSNDIIIQDRNLLKKLISYAEGFNDLGLLGCAIKRPDGRLDTNGLKLGRLGIYVERRSTENGRMGDYESIVGSFFIIKTEVLRTIGLLDETYIMMGMEDTDITERARRQGYGTYFYGDTGVTHIGSASTFNFKGNIENRWKPKDILENMSINNFVFLLRYRRRYIIPALFATYFSTVVKIRPEFSVKMPTFYSMIRGLRNLVIAASRFRISKDYRHEFDPVTDDPSEIQS